MKLQLCIAEDFGPQVSDGSKAAEYRMGRIEPYVDLCEEIVLDFAGVRPKKIRRLNWNFIFNFTFFIFN